MELSFSKVLKCDFDKAREKVESELLKEGFGILTEIDVAATLKEKLDVNFKKYLILGACNAPFAYEALQAFDEVGLLMPCNVIIYENEPESITVSAINMEAALGDILPELKEMSRKVSSKLSAVINQL